MNKKPFESKESPNNICKKIVEGAVRIRNAKDDFQNVLLAIFIDEPPSD